jgi:hypothetical protein
VDGTIDLAQFWPTGSSDGDTTRVAVERMRFGGKRTTVFDGALVRGRGRPMAVVNDGAITVRWQGIDAPELHFDPVVARGAERELPPERRAVGHRGARREARRAREGQGGDPVPRRDARRPPE